ncbi:DUF421 domain-containing protein [Limosilactobacillus fermentum]|uniref:DUF421 domain-containing protein n=1 Tax=Limosilactobacillus fermentum TaxID=1613 RepID=UPI0037BED3D5
MFARAKSFFRYVVEGQPVTLIRNGHLYVDACLYAGLSADRLMAQLRGQGVATIDQVKFAVMEQSGQLTILKNSEKNLCFPLITDGQLNIDVLDVLGYDRTWLMDQLAVQGYTRVEDVFLAEYSDGKLKLVPYPVLSTKTTPKN